MAHLTKEDKEMSLIDEAQRRASATCRCSNRVPGRLFRNKDYAICNWCGHKVYKDQEKQKEYEEKQRLEEKRYIFKKEMGKLLCI